MGNVLLHICCGPCSIYPFSLLKEKGYAITGFFYNPNIYPVEEFLKRRDALYEFSKKENFGIVYFEYLPEDFFAQIEPNLSQTERCPKCWELRLLKTAAYAQENNFEFFSTTLLVSPYQNQEKIRELGERIAQKYGVKFLYEDFRIGFREAQNRAKEMGLYRQKYCGCVYSKMEREEAILGKKK
ncbi:MAG: epoxyqueuosine reductase QueH [Candidatus Omnitrophica bacterium]|nr:epoxyqueuosine reductase QueH [Candidatus Omnitrophota bacterium]MCM8798036.1 epoxyqueuosine reductase QueH [Candidatus Omnitrophota bacterium]